MKRIEEIEELKEQFISQLKPLKIYLFGSFANGTYTEESDFDFYIIVSDEVKELKDLTTQAYRSIRKIKKRSVDIIIGTESTFENRKNSPSVENEIIKNGILLYESEDETVGYGTNGKEFLKLRNRYMERKKASGQ